MRRLLACLIVSLLAYEACFACLLGRPLDLGLLWREWQQKQARLAVLPSPKLVILAGSNAPYSHSCAIIGAALAMPCENAGVVVGFGLDIMFAGVGPRLRTGDILYLPLEPEQYTISRGALRAGADAEILLHRDRALLRALPAGRALGAALCCDLRGLLAAVAETAAARAGFADPAALLAREFDTEGDRIGTPASAADPALLSIPAPPAPDAAAVAGGYGSRLVAAFVRAEAARGVVVIGGLSTRFADAPLPDATIAAISALYTRNGGRFLMLPNRSLYPRADFFDGPEHLSAPWQAAHSRALAGALLAEGYGEARRARPRGTMPPPPPAASGRAPPQRAAWSAPAG